MQADGWRGLAAAVNNAAEPAETVQSELPLVQSDELPSSELAVMSLEAMRQLLTELRRENTALSNENGALKNELGLWRSGRLRPGQG